MTAILLFFFCFFLTLTIFGFRKSILLKNFTEVITGKVSDISSTDEGVFLVVEYPVGENKAIYKHRFSPKKIPEKKLEFLVTKYLNSPFFLLGKKENGTLVEVASYANVRITKWVYLVITLLVSYFLWG